MAPREFVLINTPVRKESFGFKWQKFQIEAANKNGDFLVHVIESPGLHCL